MCEVSYDLSIFRVYPVFNWLVNKTDKGDIKNILLPIMYLTSICVLFSDSPTRMKDIKLKWMKNKIGYIIDPLS